MRRAHLRWSPFPGNMQFLEMCIVCQCSQCNCSANGVLTLVDRYSDASGGLPRCLGCQCSNADEKVSYLRDLAMSASSVGSDLTISSAMATSAAAASSSTWPPLPSLAHAQELQARLRYRDWSCRWNNPFWFGIGLLKRATSQIPVGGIQLQAQQP